MLLDLDNVKGKCLAFGVVIFIVLVIVVITGLTSPNYPGKWQSISNSSESVSKNGTQEEVFMLGAIGQYGSNRNTIGVDKTGVLADLLVRDDKWIAGSFVITHGTSM